MNPDDRILLLGGVGLVKGRIRGVGGLLVELCDELDPVLTSSGFFARAPFRVLDGIVRFGTRNSNEPEIENQEGDYLPFAVEVNMADLRRASRADVSSALRAVVVDAIAAIGRQYKLPVEAVLSHRSVAKRNAPGS